MADEKMKRSMSRDSSRDSDGDGDEAGEPELPSATPTPPPNNGEKTPQAVGVRDPESQRTPDIYDRFPPRKKKLIVSIVAYSAFLGRECAEHWLGLL